MIRKLILCTFIFTSGSIVFAKQKLTKTPHRMGAKLGTRFDFDAMTVRGRYQTGFEGLSTVENEKMLDDLLDYRTELKDRIHQSANYVAK